MDTLNNLKLHHIVIFFAAILLIIFLCTSRSPPPKPSIDAFTNTCNGEVVLYYATWCGYSIKFLPEWEKFENHMKQNMPTIKVTRMRCEDGLEPQCKQKGVQGYPTVIFYKKDGSSIPFDVETAEERNFNNLQKFIIACTN